MPALLAFARTDLAGIRRDSMLSMLLIAPFFYAAMVRFPVPPLTDMLARDHGFDLVPYYPVILSFFTVLGPAALMAALGGMMLLEEKDARTLGALRVTPVPLALFAAYRGATITAATLAYAVVCTLLSGLAPAGILPGLLAAGLCTGVLAAAIAVFTALVAGNKVEGLAVIRAVAMLILIVPIVPYFLDTRWEWAFGLLPSYWPNKIYWLASEGAVFWPHAAAGLAYNVLLLVLLIRAFNRRAA